MHVSAVHVLPRLVVAKRGLSSAALHSFIVSKLLWSPSKETTLSRVYRNVGFTIDFKSRRLTAGQFMPESQTNRYLIRCWSVWNSDNNSQVGNIHEHKKLSHSRSRCSTTEGYMHGRGQARRKLSAGYMLTEKKGQEEGRVSTRFNIVHRHKQGLTGHRKD